MIRRGFWFTAGAVVGIAGYRRAARAARTLLPQADLLAPLGRRLAGQPPRRSIGTGASQPDAAGARQAGRQTTAGLSAGTAAFVRDVRTGMADYLDARRGI